MGAVLAIDGMKDAVCRDRNGILRGKIHFAQNSTNVRWSDYLGRPAAQEGSRIVGYRQRFDDEGRSNRIGRHR